MKKAIKIRLGRLEEQAMTINEEGFSLLSDEELDRRIAEEIARRKANPDLYDPDELQAEIDDYDKFNALIAKEEALVNRIRAEDKVRAMSNE